MKDFKNIEQLKEERNRLLNKCTTLEHSIEVNWLELKHSLRPINVVNQILEKTIQKAQSKNFITQIIKDTFTLLAYKISKAASEKMEKKMENWSN